MRTLLLTLLLAVAPAVGADTGGPDAHSLAGRWTGSCDWGYSVRHYRHDYRLILALGPDTLEVLQWIEGRDSPGGAKDFALMLLTTDAVMKRTAQLTFRGTESALQFSLATGHLEILPGKDDDACQTQGGDYTLVREGEVGTFRPSFDCARAKQPRERAICASPELSFLDQRLSLAYRAAELRIGMEDDTARNTKLRQFRAAQDEWYSKTLASCQAADCVSPIYRARIKELESMEPER